MSFITTKFQEILLSGFRGVTLTNCFIIIFHFGQISKFKKSVIPRKNNWIKISCEYALLHVSMELRWLTVLSSIFQFGQISKFKKQVTPRKKIESKISVDMHNMVYPSQQQRSKKLCWAVSEEFCWQTVLEVSFSLSKFLRSKRA